MSSSKSSQSGLGTVQRNWSASSTTADEPISWPQTKLAESQRPLDSRSQRMKDIQDGLDKRAAFINPLQSYTNVTTAHIASGSKRPLTTSSGELGSKKRRLPPSYSAMTVHASSSKSVTQSPSTTISSTTAPKASSRLAGVFLSQEQTQILRLVEQGKSLFYTGSAGTGKSVLLREIIRSLHKRYTKSPDAVAITASTGIAACNIGGVTIHSFAGIGIGEGSVKDLAARVQRNKKASTRWARTKVLIIDEISMVDGDLFDKLAEIASLLRKSKEAFGGIQVVVTGDFFQLPPVARGTLEVKFAFEAQMWNQTIKRTFNLTKVFRQADQEFVDMLNEMRFGRLSRSSIAKFKSLSRSIDYENDLGPTELFPRREDVERSNRDRMIVLNTAEKSYDAKDGGAISDPIQRDKMLANFMAPKKLVLRVGAQVMLIKNMDETLVNGSMGKVLRFVHPSVHGTDYEDVGGNGRPKSKSDKKAPPTNEMLMPVVEFLLPNRAKREVLIQPEVWKVELPNGEIQVQRQQLPLILAWAMSIHKSQGQTLERVKVDLGRVFEKGQAYVALSRATTLDGLQVLNFDERKVQAHPKVVEWSKTLETIFVE